MHKRIIAVVMRLIERLSFNSLFEMPIKKAVKISQSNIFQFSIWDASTAPKNSPSLSRLLSILYLRCLVSEANKPREFVVLKLSILYLRCCIRLLHEVCMVRESAFNSLFEMHHTSNRPHGKGNVLLSILYLRCHILPHYLWLGWRSTFQFSIWDASNGECVMSGWKQSLLLSILYLRCSGTIAQCALLRFISVLSILYLRCRFQEKARELEVEAMLYFQFSIWDAKIVKRNAERIGSVSTFNSLFEMLTSNLGSGL